MTAPHPGGVFWADRARSSPPPRFSVDEVLYVPMVLLAPTEDPDLWWATTVTERPFYKNGERRPEIPDAADARLRAPAYLWSTRPVQLPADAVGDHLGTLSDDARDAVASICGPTIGETAAELLRAGPGDPPPPPAAVDRPVCEPAGPATMSEVLDSVRFDMHSLVYQALGDLVDGVPVDAAGYVDRGLTHGDLVEAWRTLRAAAPARVYRDADLGDAFADLNVRVAQLTRPPNVKAVRQQWVTIERDMLRSAVRHHMQTTPNPGDADRALWRALLDASRLRELMPTTGDGLQPRDVVSMVGRALEAGEPLPFDYPSTDEILDSVVDDTSARRAVFQLAALGMGWAAAQRLVDEETEIVDAST